MEGLALHFLFKLQTMALYYDLPVFKDVWIEMRNDNKNLSHQIIVTQIEHKNVLRRVKPH